MTRKERWKKRGIILFVLFIGTLTILKLFDWYSKERDEKLLQNMGSRKYEVAVSEKNMSYRQMLEAIAAKDGNSTIVTRNSELYTEEEMQKINEKLREVVDTLIISPWKEKIFDLQENINTRSFGMEVQIFREFDNKIYSGRIGTLHLERDYENVTFIFDAEKYRIFSLEYNGNLAEEIDIEEIDSYRKVQFEIISKFNSDVEDLKAYLPTLEISNWLLSVRVYDYASFDFLQNVADNYIQKMGVFYESEQKIQE